MMRFMYDTVDLDGAGIIAEAGRPVQLVAGYVNGRYPSYAGLRRAFPSARPVSIAVNAGADAQVLDVEAGDASPADAVGWAVRQRRRGQIPTVYCNTSTWPAVRAAFARAGVALPLWWAAQYDDNPSLPAGAIAKQFRNVQQRPRWYDLSSVAGYWPGVDPRPVPVPPRPVPPHTVTHVVRPGDTFSGIAAAWHVTLASLEHANPRAGHPAGNVNNIWPGDVIRHP